MMTPEQVEATIQQVVGEHVDLNESFVFLFGSRATGQEQPSSDYDVGLYGGHPIPLLTIAKMREELEESPLPVHVDLVDFAMVSEAFKRLALTTAKVWNRPKNDLTLT